MYQNVVTNKKVKISDVCIKYTNKLISISDKINSNQKFDTSHKIDRLTFIKIKHLKNIIDNFNEDVNKCCLSVLNKQELLISLNNII